MAAMRRVARRGRREEERALSLLATPDEKLPKVSVVVYARNAEESIREFLDSLFSQNYPDFEIIVVDDDSADNTMGVLENIAEQHPNLIYTFVPASAKNVSRRKLAVTLGVKAASGEVVVSTASYCKIGSDNWLRTMAAPFADKGIHLSLGYCRFPKEKQTGGLRWALSYDALVADCQWLGYALAGKAFRAHRCNMAWRRDTFFENKGFASSVALQGGDDDVFVNKLADEYNTAVAISADSQLTVDVSWEQFRHLWRGDRERHVYMTRFLHTSALLIQGFGSMCRWLAVLCAVALGAVSLPNPVPAGGALLMLLLMWGYEICVYRRAAKALGSLRLWWSVPLFNLLRPLKSASTRAHANADSYRHYTWMTGMKP